MLPKLYNLTDDYNTVWDMVSDDDADLQVIQDTLEAIEGAIEDKVHSTAALVRTIDATADMVDAEIERLRKRRDALNNRAQSIKVYIQQQLEKAGIDKVKTPAFTVGLQNSPAAVQINDPAAIPAEFQIIKYDIDKKRISETLKAGGIVPGAILTQGRHLRIR
jgi:hypothetical protein